MRTLKMLLFFVVGALLVHSGATHAQKNITHKSKLAISLGSDAYHIEVAPDSNIPKGRPAISRSVLIAPGSILLTFPDYSFRHRRIKRILALNQLGEWLYVPDGPSNLIPESTIFKVMSRGIADDERWRAFTKNQASLSKEVHFTRGEIHKTVLNDQTSSYQAVIYKDDEYSKNLIDALRNQRGENEYYTIKINPLEAPFTFEVPVIDIEDILINAGVSEKALPIVLAKGPSRSTRRKISANWPKIYKLGQLYSAGCNAEEVTRDDGWKEALKRTLSGGFSLPIFGADVDLKAQLEMGTERSSSLKIKYKTGTSAFESAAVVVGNGVTLVHYGEAAECNEGAKSLPVWNRLNWEDSAPYYFGRESFAKFSDQKSGIVWNQKTGHLEVNCFHGTYDALLKELGGDQNNDRAKAFLLRHLKPTKGNWRSVFKCAFQADASIPTSRPIN